MEDATDLGVYDYLMLRGAHLNDVYEDGRNVLERCPMLLRYWIDKGIVIKSYSPNLMIESIRHGMTVPVLEMMMDKYSSKVNACGRFGVTPLIMACEINNYEAVEMLIKRGAYVDKCDYEGKTPYDVTTDDCIKQLLISHGYVVNTVL